VRKKTILVITDGIGYKPKANHNAFEAAFKPTYKYMLQCVPYSLIATHGLAVGLPDGQMGNSEVGHATLGSGRVSYQDLVKVTKELESGELAVNKTVNEFLSVSKDVHIVGLCSDGGVHSHINHLIGAAQIAAKAGKSVWFHLITDGRDVSPTSSNGYVAQIEAICSDKIKIATISGRFYSMDRDNRWSDRVMIGYNAIALGEPKSSLKPQDFIDDSYKNEITDEFIVPSSFNNYNGFKENDGVWFVNFRSDRMREIVTAIGDKNFNSFERKYIPLNILTMTCYNEAFPYPVVYHKAEPVNVLADVISKAGLRQFHTAETEKYAHVTFFFNGGIDTPFLGEDRVLINSPKVRTYDEKPEMSAYEVCDAVLKAMDEEYDFVVVNFANGDMVGHTGNFEAAIKAVETVDECLGRILAKTNEKDYSMILTSDHGNCEEMMDANGNVLTNHTVGDVWCFVKDSEVATVECGRSLSAVAPTVLTLMGLEIPKEMDAPLVKLQKNLQYCGCKVK
jgi:2,3-bisphosphoglycerate-independent phosphoglycerate mutase